MTQRTWIYIDGFNLYYRGLKDSPYKWLDLKKLCQTILDKTHKIEEIKYFTATVSGKTDPHKPKNQQTYIKALKEYTSGFSEYYGHFLSHDAWAILANPTDNQKFVKIIKTEEKGSDVNLAVHLLNDAWMNQYDCAVIISNDSDLAESISIVKKQHKKIIGLLLPPNCHPSKQLMRLADFIKTIRHATLAMSQLPYNIPGTNIKKPTKWVIETELHEQKISYTNLLVTDIKIASQENHEISFSFRNKKEYFAGKALTIKDKLHIEKIEKLRNK
ncbi:MAG: NYN domain-containing protein [Candidatus Omnitrophota bacterium]|jgi:uncharacterized LabA/DUF88 family protein